MILTKDLGGYVRDKVYLEGSFRVDSSGDASEIRDGNSNLIASVTHESAGLYTVAFASVDNGGPTDLPEKIVDWHIDIAQGVAPTAFVKPHLVVDSYSQVTRSFQIQCLDFSTPSATDPDEDDMISFYLAGSITSSGTD